MDWDCFFVFKNSCNCKPDRVLFVIATVFAAIVFLWSLSMTVLTPVCVYNLNTRNKPIQLNGYDTERVRIKRSHLYRNGLPSDKMTILSLQKNISELTKHVYELQATISIYEKLGKVIEKDSSLKTFGNKLHQQVLITSVPDSGDVFLGEFFNRNPKVFYLFEPFHSLKYFRENRPPEVYESMVSSFLQGILDCNFSKFQFYTHFLSVQYRALIHRLSSRTIASPPLCPEILYGRYYNIRQCTLLRPPTLAAICKLHSYTFIKTTQIVDLKRLAYLSTPEGTAEYPFRVVELVRDPRAIVHVLVQKRGAGNVTEEFFERESRKICRQQKRNFEYAKKTQSTLADRHIMVKYEDIISDPSTTLGKLSEFLGLPMTLRDRAWLSNVMSEGFSWPANVVGSDMRPGLRPADDLVKSIGEWQGGLTEHQIRVVENRCGEVMRLLGYKTFNRSIA